jgi:hypothetical protein
MAAARRGAGGGRAGAPVASLAHVLRAYLPCPPAAVGAGGYGFAVSLKVQRQDGAVGTVEVAVPDGDPAALGFTLGGSRPAHVSRIEPCGRDPGWM